MTLSKFLRMVSSSTGLPFTYRWDPWERGRSLTFPSSSIIICACFGRMSLPPKMISFGGTQPCFPTVVSSKLKGGYFSREGSSVSCWWRCHERCSPRREALHSVSSVPCPSSAFTRLCVFMHTSSCSLLSISQTLSSSPRQWLFPQQSCYRVLSH